MKKVLVILVVFLYIGWPNKCLVGENFINPPIYYCPYATPITWNH